MKETTAMPLPQTTSPEADTAATDQAFYDRRWDANYTNTEREYNRVYSTIAAVPADCVTVLDVGTGDGLLANELAATGKAVTAVDISKVALSRVKGPTLLLSADNLSGVANQSYDMVLCTEMLEHLDQATYAGALREFNRVARKAILITVPNRELMDEHMGRCGSCGSKFHIWGHRRCFTNGDLKELFADFEPVSITEFGDKLPEYNRPLLWMRTAVANSWFVDERSPCPECHSFQTAVPRYPMLARVSDLINSNLPRIRKHPWLMAVYRRRGAHS